MPCPWPETRIPVTNRKLDSELARLSTNGAQETVNQQKIKIMKASNYISDDSKKKLWKFIIQTIINVLAAVLTALGATSCMGLH